MPNVSESGERVGLVKHESTASLFRSMLKTRFRRPAFDFVTVKVLLVWIMLIICIVHTAEVYRLVMVQLGKWLDDCHCVDPEYEDMCKQYADGEKEFYDAYVNKPKPFFYLLFVFSAFALLMSLVELFVINPIVLWFSTVAVFGWVICMTLTIPQTQGIYDSTIGVPSLQTVPELYWCGNLPSQHDRDTLDNYQWDEAPVLFAGVLELLDFVLLSRAKIERGRSHL